MILDVTLSHYSTREYETADNVTRAGLLIEWSATARRELEKDGELFGVVYRHSRTGEILLSLTRR